MKEKLTGNKILIVDDEEALRMLLERYFSKRGLIVSAASSAREVLDIFKPGNFVFVLLDVDLGNGMDGITLAQKLRELEPGLRIAIMSGNGDNAAKVEAGGFGRMVKKPFTLSSLDYLTQDSGTNC